jgi:hypothetical protein
VKKGASEEKAKKKTRVRKPTAQEKTKENVPFAHFLPPPPVVQPTFGANRSLLYWLGG